MIPTMLPSRLPVRLFVESIAILMPFCCFRGRHNSPRPTSSRYETVSGSRIPDEVIRRLPQKNDSESEQERNDLRAHLSACPFESTNWVAIDCSSGNSVGGQSVATLPPPDPVGGGTGVGVVIPAMPESTLSTHRNTLVFGPAHREFRSRAIDVAISAME